VSPETFLTFSKKNRNLRHLEMANSRRIFSCLSPLTREIMDNMLSLQEVNLSENSIPHFQHMAEVAYYVFNYCDVPFKSWLRCELCKYSCHSISYAFVVHDFAALL